MIPTSQLIDDLAARGGEAPPLRPPLLRAGLWLLFVFGALVLFAISHPIRDDFGTRLSQPGYVACVLATVATGILSAVAAFLVSIPDRSRAWMLLPMPTLILWLGIVFVGTATRWVSLEDSGVTAREGLEALATLGLIGAPLSLSLLFMMRYAEASRPVSASLMGGLAVGAIVAAALCVFHPVQAAVLDISANAGTAFLFVVSARLFGPRLLHALFGAR